MVYIYDAQVQLNGAFLLTILFINPLNQFVKEIVISLLEIILKQI